jgi:hypothetical protein
MRLSKEYFSGSLGDYHRAEAMHYAQYWHGGQFTELYKLCSSGEVDSPCSLLSEIEDCKPTAEEPSGEELCDDGQLDCLKAYATALIAETPEED